MGFTIDIVPAADETSETKSRLTQKSLAPELIGTAIAIPKHNGERNYSWLTNNPKGFRAWFDKINDPFLAASREAYRQHLFEDNRTLFSSVEEIPHELDRSALQRVIQLLKYHRDVFYAKLKDGDDLKPISAIINAVITQIASQHTPDCSVFELLEYVLNELNIYAQQENSHLRSLRRCMAAVLFSLDRMEDGTYQTLLTRRTIWPTGGIKTEESQCISSGGSKLSGPTSLNPCNRKTNSNLEQQSKMGLGACRYLLSWEKVL